MNALAKVEEQKPQEIAPVPAPPITILDIISRAAFDPNVDADKIGKLLEMARQVRADDAKAAYARAMVAMKPLLPVIDRKGRIVIHEKGKEKIDANIIQSTPYALWEDIDAAITPILATHGFVLTFRTGAGAEGRITVTGVLTHQDGHSEESTMPLPLDTSGSKNNVQAAGSSTSYGKRYTATALLNIRTKGEDDDGEGAGGYHSNPMHDAIHTPHTMQPEDDDAAQGVKNFVEQNKKFLDNCKTVAEIQEWIELREPELHRLKKRDLKSWNELRLYKEARIANINLEGVDPLKCRARS